MASEEVTQFVIELDDGREAECWIAQSQPYSNCVFSAGLVEGIPPDDYFLRLKRDEEEPTTLFLRKDEAMAILFCLSGALWSKEMIEMDNNND